MEKISEALSILLKRWTAKSPIAYRLITDVSLGVGIAATVLPHFYGATPNWVVTVGALLVSVTSKLTVESK